MGLESLPAEESWRLLGAGALALAVSRGAADRRVSVLSGKDLPAWSSAPLMDFDRRLPSSYWAVLLTRLSFAHWVLLCAATLVFASNGAG